MPASPDLPRPVHDVSSRQVCLRKYERTYDNAVAQDRIDRVNGDLGDVRRGRDVREVRCRPALRVAQVDEASDEAVETERDVRRGEAEHEHGDPEDERRDLAGAAEAQDVDV